MKWKVNRKSGMERHARTFQVDAAYSFCMFMTLYGTDEYYSTFVVIVPVKGRHRSDRISKGYEICADTALLASRRSYKPSRRDWPNTNAMSVRSPPEHPKSTSNPDRLPFFRSIEHNHASKCSRDTRLHPRPSPLSQPASFLPPLPELPFPQPSRRPEDLPPSKTLRRRRSAPSLGD